MEFKLKRFEIPYVELNTPETLPQSFELTDMIGGFDSKKQNQMFHDLDCWAEKNNKQFTVWWHQLVPKQTREFYKNIEIKFSADFQKQMNFQHFLNYNVHPEVDYKNFICCFNGSPHTSRKLLSAILYKFGWFNPAYCSKNFTCTVDNITGYVQDYVGDQETFYSKFFIGDGSAEFLQGTNSFGHVRFEHNQNIYNLEKLVTHSFLQIVSESLATSFVPYITEKFLYSVVTRGLFLAYAQPGWHNYLEKYYGFRKYTRLFDYRFDTIENPVERLVELMSMLSKFSHLSTLEWHDLYLLEQDTIEYNYNHYFSGNYLEKLRQYEY